MIMYRIMLLIVLSLCFKFSNAQFDNRLIVKCLDLVNPDTAILYYPIENHIKVYYNNKDSNNFTLSIIGAKIKKVNDHYIVKVHDRNRVTLLVHNNWQNNQNVDKVFFIIKDYKEPAIKLCGVKGGGYVSHKTLLKENKIMLNKDENPFLKQNYQIKGFKLTFSIDNQNISLISNSEYLTDEQKKALKNLKKGQKFYIEDVILFDDDNNKEINVKPSVFIIQ